MVKKKKTILALGDTGCGKSLFGKILFGFEAVSENSANSGTATVEFYENNEFIYVDTPGFNDTKGITDKQTFLEIMRKFERRSTNSVYEINSILWFCRPDSKATNSLQRQAKFIHQFFDYNNGYVDDLWNCVLIVFKGLILLDDQTHGPKEAAKIMHRKDNIEVNHFGCLITNIEENTASIKEGFRNLPGMLTKEQAKIEVLNIINRHSPIQIHFKKEKCTKCSLVIDPRVASPNCHGDLMRKSEQVEHSGRYVNGGAGLATFGLYTAVGAVVGNVPGAVVGGAVGLVGAAISELLDKKTWSCCGKSDFNSKCNPLEYDVCRICDQTRIYTNRCSDTSEHDF
ncbi:1048_t:CDS:1 [Paraglomus brasilianum]|uniref:1048_t:CDS:1 n=1 Tax=Paraglomus brasilianum TaxID=144538 RepID=A0A9N9GSV8_9GLOM|nr:1048_t:CDS:1 [Paraglomus brasilianum]